MSGTQAHAQRVTIKNYSDTPAQGGTAGGTGLWLTGGEGMRVDDAYIENTHLAMKWGAAGHVLTDVNGARNWKVLESDDIAGGPGHINLVHSKFTASGDYTGAISAVDIVDLHDNGGHIFDNVDWSEDQGSNTTVRIQEGPNGTDPGPEQVGDTFINCVLGADHWVVENADNVWINPYIPTDLTLTSSATDNRFEHPRVAYVAPTVSAARTVVNHQSGAYSFPTTNVVHDVTASGPS